MKLTLTLNFEIDADPELFTRLVEIITEETHGFADTLRERVVAEIPDTSLSISVSWTLERLDEDGENEESVDEAE